MAAKFRTADTLFVRRKPGRLHQGLLEVEGTVLPCALGRSGFSALKLEGDGATPAGAFDLLYGYYRADRMNRPETGLPLFPIRQTDGWCDEPGHANYNRPVTLPCPASTETMMRDDHLYDICIVLNFNIRPRMRNGGSAIFFHLAREGFQPTEGCVALRRSDMLRLLPFIGPQTRMVTG